MADALGTDAPVDTPAPEAAAAPAEPGTEAAAAPVEPGEWDDPEALEEGVQTFDRKYVESLRDREARYRIKARDLNAAVTELGGLEEAKKAAEWAKQAQTEDGVIKLFIEAGTSLGLGFEQLEKLFDASDAQTAQTAIEGQPNDDDVVTWAEAKELLRKEVLEPAEQREQQRILAHAKETVTASIDALKLETEKEKQAVLALGQNYLPDGDFDPEHIRVAILKGHEDFIAARDRDREAYIAAKIAEREAVPSSTGAAGAPGGETPAEPESWEDAKARGRARLRAAQG